MCYILLNSKVNQLYTHTQAHTQTHVHSFLDSTPYSLQNVKFPLLHSRSFLIIYLYIVVCLCQSYIPVCPPPALLVTIRLFAMSVALYLLC